MGKTLSREFVKGEELGYCILRRVSELLGQLSVLFGKVFMCLITSS